MHFKLLVGVRQEAAALSVAMPNREGRALHARSQDAGLINKLQLKLGQLMAVLGVTEPPAEDSPEYLAALSTLRDEELSRLQAEIEGQVSALAALDLERPRLGAASKVTRAHSNSMKRRRKRIREFVAVMQTWQQTDAPSSPLVQQLPQVWSEAVISCMLVSTHGGKVLLLRSRLRWMRWQSSLGMHVRR
jgi:hypothetical protein